MTNTGQKPPFSIARLDHIVLRTANIEPMLAFYLALGADIARHVDDVGLYQLRVGASMLDLIDTTKRAEANRFTPHPSAQNMDHLALRIDPFDPDTLLPYLERLATTMTEVLPRLFGADGYGPSIYLTDPDDNRVELKGPPTPIPTEPTTKIDPAADPNRSAR